MKMVHGSEVPFFAKVQALTQSSKAKADRAKQEEEELHEKRMRLDEPIRKSINSS